MSLRSRIESDLSRVVAFRRDLHQHPELMYQEVRTSQQVEKFVGECGLEMQTGLAGGTGVLGYLPATHWTEDSKTVALRADMDALPIHEETGLEYSSSTDGVMHACGHDGHTAILAGVARALMGETQRMNDVLFLFQPAEEGGAGGKRMVEDGCLDGKLLGKKADVIYGLHGWPSEDTGEFFVCNGPMMAATDSFEVKVLGAGGHAAVPQLATDPIVASAQIVTAIQTIASRNVDPLDAIVFSVTAIHGGMAFNVIPEDVTLRGTMRTLLPETRELGKRRFFEIVEGVAQALGCRVEIDWHEGYPVTANDVWSTDRLRQIAKSVHGADRVNELAKPVMGGEDFSYYGEVCPASFYFVGLKREGDSAPAMVHTPRFDFNDAVIADCVELMSELALQPVNA